MSLISASLPADFAQRIAERDNPPPPPPLSQEPAAIQARLESWLRTTHGVGNARGRLHLGRMLLALMQHPERHTGQLATAAGLGPRAATRVTTRLCSLGLTTWEARGYYRYHRLTRPSEDALLEIVTGKKGAVLQG